MKPLFQQLAEYGSRKGIFNAQLVLKKYQKDLPQMQTNGNSNQDKSMKFILAAN